jgi:hypothetical protein
MSPIRLSLRFRVFALYDKLHPWAEPGCPLHGLRDPFDGITPGPKSQVGKSRGPICNSFVNRSSKCAVTMQVRNQQSLTSCYVFCDNQDHDIYIYSSK